MHLHKNWQEKCVMARIMRQGKMHQRNFSLKQFGTWKTAWNAAKAWRDEQLPQLPPCVMNAKGRMTSRNQSGEVGVHLAHHVLRKKSGRECEYWRWVGRWPGCPLAGGVSWSVLKFGDDDAFALAVLCRKMEESKRSKVISELEKIYGSKKHEKIMTFKAQEP